MNARIGLVLHSADAAALAEAQRLTRWLTERGHEVVAVTDDAGEIPHVTPVDDASFGEGLELAISLGGDGTVLRTVELLGESAAKILGVNFGDLGYLTVVDPDELDRAVERSLSGDHEIEDRMLVAASFGGETFHALNEIVVERSPGDTTIRVGVTIDGKPFTSYPADGLILSLIHI